MTQALSPCPLYVLAMPTLSRSCFPPSPPSPHPLSTLSQPTCLIPKLLFVATVAIEVVETLLAAVEILLAIVADLPKLIVKIYLLLLLPLALVTLPYTPLLLSQHFLLERTPRPPWFLKDSPQDRTNPLKSLKDNPQDRTNLLRLLKDSPNDRSLRHLQWLLDCLPHLLLPNLPLHKLIRPIHLLLRKEEKHLVLPQTLDPVALLALSVNLKNKLLGVENTRSFVIGFRLVLTKHSMMSRLSTSSDQVSIPPARRL